MTNDEESRARMVLEWVTCPECSTTFRVSVPSQYDEIDVELEEEGVNEGDYSAYQQVRCVDPECRTTFFLGFDVIVEEEEEE